jgi:hypothetical protein
MVSDGPDGIALTGSAGFGSSESRGSTISIRLMGKGVGSGIVSHRGLEKSLTWLSVRRGSSSVNLLGGDGASEL